MTAKKLNSTVLDSEPDEKIIASYPFSTPYGKPLGEVVLRRIGDHYRLSTTFANGGKPVIKLFPELGIALGTYWAVCETVIREIKERFL